MKVLFLDIDGVLNSTAYRTEKLLNDRDYSVLIEPQKVANLRKIVDVTGAQIVLSSSWNKFWDYDPVDNAGKRINNALTAYGLRIMDKTPWSRDSSRGEQIDAWLRANNHVEQYVILDDNDYCWNCRHRAHWVKTDSAIGLDEAAVAKAINVLRGSLIPVQQERRESNLQRMTKTFRLLCGFVKRMLRYFLA